MEVEQKKETINPFTIVNSINNGKTIFDEHDLVSVEASYVPFIINRQFSLFTDTIFHSNELNKYSDMSKKAQYLYYFHSVKPKKRYAKWPKKNKTDDLQMVSDYFKVNYRKAAQLLMLLNENQLKEIHESMQIGGSKGNDG